jgi:hypothetical protein
MNEDEQLEKICVEYNRRERRISIISNGTLDPVRSLEVLAYASLSIVSKSGIKGSSLFLAVRAYEKTMIENECFLSKVFLFNGYKAGFFCLLFTQILLSLEFYGVFK